MTVWLDADAAPAPVKEILFRAAARRSVPVVVVANSAQRVPKSKWVRFVQVGGGLDAADEHIAASCAPGDLVITDDVPLAAAAVEAGAQVLRFRGEMLDEGNVTQRLAVRDMLDDMRGAGMMTSGPPPFGKKERQQFANALDRWLTQRGR